MKSSPEIARPTAVEYAPYYDRYISLVPAGDVLQHLSTQINATLAVLRGITEAQSLRRYAPGKWSIKEVLGHVCDTERVMSYRALRFGRGDQTPLPGFDENDYVQAGNCDARAWADLIGEFETVRAATVSLFRGFETAATERLGTANNTAVSVRALAYIIAGHERHHLKVIQDRYLPVLQS